MKSDVRDALRHEIRAGMDDVLDRAVIDPERLWYADIGLYEGSLVGVAQFLARAVGAEEPGDPEGKKIASFRLNYHQMTGFYVSDLTGDEDVTDTVKEVVREEERSETYA